MNYCFPCFSSHKSKKEPESGDNHEQKDPNPGPGVNNNVVVDHANIKSQNFTFRDLATATKNFRQECLLGEGGFGRVYKGTLKDSGQVVAVKQLDRNGLQGNKEFLVEVVMLSLLHHENLVNLIGYCADGDQRLLVYEFMPGGSVEDRLIDLDPNDKPLNWSTRMKIAYGAAKGLEYLHVEANPPVIYRDLKSSNILLDNDFNPKLSDFGLAKLGASSGGKAHVSSRVMGTYGYCAPEYARTGDLTVKSDVYSFGVVLLELITGRPAIDNTKPADEQNLVSWVQPKFRNPKLFPSMADPLLKGKFREKDLNQAVAIAAMCLQEEACVRPLMSDIVDTLGFLASVREEDIPALAQASIKPRDEEEHNNVGENVQNRDSAGKRDVKHVSFENLESDKHGFSEGSDHDDEDVREHHGMKLLDNEDGDNSEHPDESDTDDEDADRFSDGEDEDDDGMDQQALLEGKAFESSSSSGSSISSHGNGSSRGKDSSKGGSIKSSRKLSKKFSQKSVSSTSHSRKSSQKRSNYFSDSSRSGSKKGSISLERKASAVSMANGFEKGSISRSDRSRSGSNKGSFSLEHKTSGVSIADGSEGSISHSDSSRSGSMKGGFSLEHKTSGVSVADGSKKGSISRLDSSRSGSMKRSISLKRKTSGVSMTDGESIGSVRLSTDSESSHGC